MSVVNDQILLKGMKFYGYHGVLPQEQELGQLFIVDLEIRCDLREAGQNDDLAKTVDYSQVFELVKGIVIGEPFKLLEALAERIAASLLDEYLFIEEILVRVYKPQAPINGVLSHVAVEIRRFRDVP